MAAAPTLASAPAKAGAASIQTADTRCANYPGSIYTITNLRLKKHRVEPGEGNKAIVHVRSQRGTPKGSIKLSILPVRGSGQEVRLFHKLHNGVARVHLPRDLKRGKYGVQAKYVPKSCSRWAKSRSDVKYFRVTRRR